MKVVLTGATGLVGSRFFDLLKSRYEIVPVSSSYGVNIVDKKKITRFLKEKNPALIVHMAAKTNVDGCEEDKSADKKKLKGNEAMTGKDILFDRLDPDEWSTSDSAFGINVIGTKNISDFAKDTGTRMVYISTDFVFDGEKDGFYTEEDTVTPINWYGQTKLWGEKTIPEEGLITRISYPFGHKSKIKQDLIWRLVELIATKDTIKLVSDQIITPTFIDDIVYALSFLIDHQARGIFNVVGQNSLSPYEIGVAIAREFGLAERKIELTTRTELYRGRARRPFKVMLKNDKLRDLGFEMTDFYRCLRLIKKDL